MRTNLVVRALRSSLRGRAGGMSTGALGRGLDAAGQLGSTATEFMRVRRDPAEVALRRRRAAIRRVNVWGAGTVVGGAGTAALAVSMGHGGLDASLIFSLILLAALTVWCAIGLFRSVGELRRRNRAVAELPPPQPARRAVASAIRSDVGRLDNFSDGLRHLVMMMPTGAASGLRDDVIAAADQAERLLRHQAQEYTVLSKTSSGAPKQAQAGLRSTATAMATRIRDGVAEYGRLVAAATDTVAASAELRAATADLQDPTDRLHALAMGMREIAQHADGTSRSEQG